jgi:hypothetical protein
VTQVNSSPGVPGNLPTVVASSATPILGGPPKTEGAGIIGTGVIATNGVLYWVSSTGANNVWASVSVQQGKVVSPFTSHTPIIYGPVIFSGNEAQGL